MKPKISDEPKLIICAERLNNLISYVSFERATKVEGPDIFKHLLMILQYYKGIYVHAALYIQGCDLF